VPLDLQPPPSSNLDLSYFSVLSLFKALLENAHLKKPLSPLEVPLNTWCSALGVGCCLRCPLLGVPGLFRSRRHRHGRRTSKPTLRDPAGRFPAAHAWNRRCQPCPVQSRLFGRCVLLSSSLRMLKPVFDHVTKRLMLTGVLRDGCMLQCGPSSALAHCFVYTIGKPHSSSSRRNKEWLSSTFTRSKRCASLSYRWRHILSL
jgi:hypothetical protein